MKTIRHIAAGIVVLSLVGFATSASAEGPELYDWSADQAPVMLRSGDGLVFLGTDKEPYRAYAWETSDSEKTPDSYFSDLDGDKAVDIVGNGDPTFALKHNSDPYWILEDGCDEAIVADFYEGDGRHDIMCRNRGKIAIYTYDKQEWWSANLGVNMDWCRAGDINGDLQADLECKIAGRDKYVRIDSEGEILAEESKETKLSDDEIDYDAPEPVDAEKVLSGEKMFDLNGDGTAEESLLADGEALVLQSKSAKKALARVELGGEVKTALVNNLDGEGTPEIVAVAGDSIVVIDAKGNKIGGYPADAGSYERYPVAELKSVYANGFKKDGEAKNSVKDVQDDLADCYSRRVRGNLFVGIGQIIMKVYVDDGGTVTEVEKVHSDLDDSTVESCAKRVLKGLDYPNAKSEDEKGTVNTSMKFTFGDKPK